MKVDASSARKAPRRIREYELYALSPDVFSNLTSWYSEQHTKPWVIRLRAKSIKQAYWLMGNQVVSPDGKAVGITQVGHSWGPSMLESWPFSFDISEVDNSWGM